MPWTSHLPSGERPLAPPPPRPPPPPGSISVSHWPYSAGVGGSLVCATARVHVRVRVRKSVLRMEIKVSQEGEILGNRVVWSRLEKATGEQGECPWASGQPKVMKNNGTRASSICGKSGADRSRRSRLH